MRRDLFIAGPIPINVWLTAALGWQMHTANPQGRNLIHTAIVHSTRRHDADLL